MFNNMSHPLSVTTADVVMSGISVAVLANGDANISAVFSCWPMALLDRVRALQDWMPSYHVCSTFALPALPQFLNQEPPRPQQLILPDFATVPHLEHMEPMVVVAAAAVGVYMWEISPRRK